jgi:hypothetical protein
MTRLVPIVAVVLALVAAGCGGGRPSSPPARDAGADRVAELEQIGQLRTAFNAHEGLPRLIVLASPT